MPLVVHMLISRAIETGFLTFEERKDDFLLRVKFAGARLTLARVERKELKKASDELRRQNMQVMQ